MADAVIVLAADTSNSGKMVDQESLTVGVNTVYRQRVQMTGALAAEIAHISNADPLAAAYALNTRQVDSIFGEAGHDNVTTAAWTTATALNTALTVNPRSWNGTSGLPGTGYDHVTVSAIVSGGTVTGGGFNFEISADGTTWWAISGLRYDLSLQETVGAPSTWTTMAWHFNVPGVNYFRVRLGTTLTAGTGTPTLTISIQQDHLSPASVLTQDFNANLSSIVDGFLPPASKQSVYGAIGLIFNTNGGNYQRVRTIQGGYNSTGVGVMAVNHNATQRATYVLAAAITPAAFTAGSTSYLWSLMHPNTVATTSKLRRVVVSLYANSVASNFRFELVKINTSGTGTTLAGQIVDGNDVASGLTSITTLTVAPSVVGNSFATQAGSWPVLPATSPGPILLYDWQEGGETKCPSMRNGATEGIALRVIASAATTATFGVQATWTEGE